VNPHSREVLEDIEANAGPLTISPCRDDGSERRNARRRIPSFLMQEGARVGGKLWHFIKKRKKRGHFASIHKMADLIQERTKGGGGRKKVKRISTF